MGSSDARILLSTANYSDISERLAPATVVRIGSPRPNAGDG